MPCRAILSVLFVLIGTLPGSAALLNPGARNAPFQPRSSLSPAILKPDQARILSGEQQVSRFNVQRIAPVRQAPAQVKMNRTAFTQPDGAVMRPAVTKAAGGS